MFQRRSAEGVIQRSEPSPQSRWHSMDWEEKNPATVTDAPALAEHSLHLRVRQRIARMPTGGSEASQRAPPRRREVEDENAARPHALRTNFENLRYERGCQVHEQMQTENGVKAQAVFRQIFCTPDQNGFGRMLSARHRGHLMARVESVTGELHEAACATRQTKYAATAK